jgi:hypothetical protein
MIGLNVLPGVVVFLIGLALVVVGTEIGWRLGISAKGRGENNIYIVEQCLFGLLALLVGFTFLMALTRFEARREAVINEANAIGTAALRARLLPEPHRAETLKLLREYVGLRVKYIGMGRTFSQLPDVIQRSNEIQERLWRHATTVATKDNAMVPTGLFIQALNEVIDVQAKRLAEVRNEIPEIVLLTLFAVTAISGAVAGYAGGAEEHRSRWPTHIMGLLVCAILFLIVDLDRPAGGFISITQQPMIDTANSIAAFAD